jgi:general secretion pathway protein D
LTVRDTAENVLLIGDLLQSVDKDRAEVVMDVNIYEVTRSDLQQFGNQIGVPGQNGAPFPIGGSPGFSLLTDNGIVNSSFGRGVNLAALVGGVPTALAAALVIPPSTLYSFQSRDNTKLIASTQVHAFNGEESQARIGQRVPVQTAQAYPFGIQTGQPNPGQSFPSGGFPVINYEPTGLTLKFTPQVFPNLDVQVKMNIESKDVLGAASLTPTFTERTISGTARVQNNRTMLLASVSTEVDSEGRQGLPILGGLPVLGRFFTAPKHENRQIDIVISVTPRVLRAPAVTPRDEEMRPSGTLQSPTTGSLEAMIVEADRDERIAAARAIPRNVSIQLPDAPVQAAPNANHASASNTQAATPANSNTSQTNGAVATSNPPVTQTSTSNGNTAQASVATSTKQENNAEELPSYVPAPRSLVSDRAAAEVATVNASDAGSQNAVLTSLPKPVETSLNTKTGARAAQISFLPTDDMIKVGEKRRFEIQLSSDLPLSLAMFALKFDPKVLKVNAITPGALFGLQPDSVPVVNQSIDPTGTCFISLSTNKSPIKGSGSILVVEVEAVGLGDASLVFVKDTLRLVGVDARDVVAEIIQGSVTAGR